MIGLDCNILVQLAFADHPGNAKTLAAVQAETILEAVTPQTITQTGLATVHPLFCRWGLAELRARSMTTRRNK